MRMVQVTTDVFAAIWADRQPGEETENDIIGRKFGLKFVPNAPQDRDPTMVTGWEDPKYGVRVAAGFEIYRAFKKKKYTARAIQGLWLSSHDENGYKTLNDLSVAIGAGVENAWWNWWYDDPETGEAKRVSELRDPKTIRRVKS